LSHDKLDIFGIDTSLIHRSLVSCGSSSGLRGSGGRLSSARLSGSKRRKVIGAASGLLRELLERALAKRLAEVLDLRLTKDNVGIGARRLKDLRLRNNEEDLRAG
jgi:hypothetical protein